METEKNPDKSKMKENKGKNQQKDSGSQNRAFFLDEGVGKSGSKYIENAFEILILRKCDKPFDWYKQLNLDKSDASKIRRGLIIPPLWLRLKIAEYFEVDSTAIWRFEDILHIRKLLKKQGGGEGK